MGRPKINRLGEQNRNKLNNLMTIIEYNDTKNIVVEFENGYKVESEYQYFKKGSISNPYDKTIYNMGYIGEGEYKSTINRVKTIQYKYWVHMLERCYSEAKHKKFPTYKGCIVCQEWHCFQTFAKWFDENYYEYEGERIHLDKDILYKNNKVYSPETCIFVPERINTLFTKSDASRGEYPIGVSLHKSSNKFGAYCNTFSKKEYLGLFDTPEDAFYDGYKPFKEAYIKEIANKYKDKIPQSLYTAMINYVVEITD